MPPEAKPSVIIRIQRFFRDTWSELLKVIWPSADEVKRLTLVVILAIGAVAIFIFFVDSILSWLTKPLFAVS
jgi:preprotein translocase subunit SecE